MKDRVLVGFFAGILAAVGADIANWILYGLGLTEIRFLEWASVLFLGHLPVNSIEVIVSQLAQIVWDGLMGVIFIMLIPRIKSDYIVYKGGMYAVALHFGFRAITVIFKVPPLNSISVATFLSFIVCSIIWGLLVGWFIKRFSVFYDNQAGSR